MWWLILDGFCRAREDVDRLMIRVHEPFFVEVLFGWDRGYLYFFSWAPMCL